MGAGGAGQRHQTVEINAEIPIEYAGIALVPAHLVFGLKWPLALDLPLRGRSTQGARGMGDTCTASLSCYSLFIALLLLLLPLQFSASSQRVSRTFQQRLVVLHEVHLL